MGTMTRSSFAKALYPGVSGWYGREYKRYDTEYTSLFDTIKSRRAYEEHVGITSFGLAQKKTENGSIAYDEERQAFVTRFSHTVFALGFTISRELMEDDLYDIVGKRRAQGLARSMRETKEIIGSNVYNRAFNSSYVGGDGVELCSTVHPNFAGGTWSNELTTAADLSEASLEQACIDIAKWTDDRGLKIALKPNKLIIPVDLQFEAERILMSPYRNGTADNDVNALYRMGKFPGGVIVNHYLTDTDAWFIKTDLPSGSGMVHYQRRPMEFSIDNDFDTEIAKYKATERYGFGWVDPRAIFGSPGA